MSQFYALMPDNTVKYIKIEQKLVQHIRDIFINGAEKLKPKGITEDEFNGDIMARNGENITYVTYSLPQNFSNIPNNQADMSQFDIKNDTPKSIFWYEEGKYFFQVFNKKNLLSYKFIMVDLNNTFTRMKENAFIIEQKVNAIYENGKLYFESYTSANQIFPLLDFVTEATDGEIKSFGENENLEANADDIKKIANVKTRRLIKVLSSTTNVSTFIGKSLRTKKSLLKKYGIKAQINNEGKLILPIHNVSELNRTLEFLNEDIFKGAITDSLYLSNSKKKDTR